MNISSFMLLFHSAAAMLVGWLYFRRYTMTRPPIGVFNIRDIAIMIGMIVLIPFLYLVLPLWMVASLLGMVSISVLYFVWEPVLRSGRLIWLVTILLASADLLTVLIPQVNTMWFLIVNNIIMLIIVVGASNLWAQSGMKARDAVILGAALSIYDLIATSLLPLMNNLFARLDGLPFTPTIAWPMNTSGEWLGIGLGDLVLVTVFPLVMRKAFGRNAGLLAMVLGLGAIGALVLVVSLGRLAGAFPVMVVLGPLMVFQYMYWHRRLPQERTTREYLLAEPIE